jgi:hypothetical protein
VFLIRHRVIGPLSALALLTANTSAPAADGWTCRQDGLTRQVVVYYPSSPDRLPCDVFYLKPDEQALPKRLWSAGNEAGYCERQARQFVGRLGSLGWTCTADSAEAVVD